MNTVWHQVRKDLRYVRWPLALWAALLVAATAVQVFKVDTYFQERALRAEWSHAALVFAATLVSWLVAARIVHADPLDGTTAFWLTRPIGAQTLFLAKIGLIVAPFVVGPAIALCVGAAANGVVGADLAQVAVESALVRAGFILVIVLLATFTRDIARLVLAAIVASIAWLGVYTLVRVVQLGPEPIGDTSARLSGVLLATATVVVGSLAVAAHQYSTRRTRRSAFLAILAAAVALIVVSFWPWNILRGRQPIDSRVCDPSAITVTLENVGEMGGSYPGRTAHLYGRFDAVGAPAGWVILPLEIDLRARFADGSTVTSHRETGYGRFGVPGPSLVPGWYGMAAVGHATGGAWLNYPRAQRPPDPGGRLVLAGALPREALRRRSAMPATYEATLTLGAFEAVVASVVPLRAGASGRVGPLVDTVLGVRRGHDRFVGDTAEIQVRTTWPQFLFPHHALDTVYVLRNKARGEIVFGLPNSHPVPYPFLTGVHLRVRYGRIRFARSASAELVLDDDWLAGAELLMLAFEERGTFTKTVRIPNIVLDEVSHVPAR